MSIVSKVDSLVPWQGQILILQVSVGMVGVNGEQLGQVQGS